MKKIPKSFKESESIIKRLVFAVDDFMGDGDLITYAEDICEYGMVAGFSNMCYYSDTNKFYEDNEDVIWDLLYQQKEEMGYKHILEMIASFNGAQDVGSDTQFKNLLTWYAAEEAARYVVEQLNRKKN